MNAGRLRHHIQIYKPVETPDGGGGKSLSLKLVGASWAEIKPASAYAIQTAAASKQEISHKIRMRFRKDLTTDHSIKFDGRTFDIKAIINEEERNRFLTVTAQERSR